MPSAAAEELWHTFYAKQQSGLLQMKKRKKKAKTVST
jgi:hypothetical protein